MAIVVALLVAQPFTLRMGIAAQSAPRAGASGPPQHYVVLLVIDGGQLAPLKRLKLPHIDALMKNGMIYDQAYVLQMSSVTPSVHVTLGTGTTPSQNGFLGLYAKALQEQSRTDVLQATPGHLKPGPPPVLTACATRREQCRFTSPPPTNH